MSSFIPTRLGNPCVHCGDTEGKCRTHKTRELHLCVPLHGSPKGEKSQGFVVIGDTADGRWAQLLPDNGAEYSSEKFKDLQAEWRRQEEQAKQERLAGEMPAVERDKYYREILAQLILRPEDKADLVKRGFSEEQIIKSGFKSVERWQKLNKNYPGNLPGINNQGNGLLSHTPGYVCPIIDVDGLIVGLQVRKRVLLNGDKQRYYFLSQDSSIRLNDQIPLAVFIPEKCKANKILLVEGVGAKPFLTSERLEVPVIGAAGGQWASSAIHLQNTIDKLKQLTKFQPDVPIEVEIAPDAGAVSNKSVVNQYRRAANLLRTWGYKVTFSWWGQVDKSFADIDELAPNQLKELSSLSIADFKALCIKWGGLEERDGIDDLVIIDYYEKVAKAQRRLHSLSYPTDLYCDSTKKYLPDLVGRIPLKGIVLIKAPKGSGKSKQIKKIKDFCCGYWVEKITYPEPPKQAPLTEPQPKQLNFLGNLKAAFSAITNQKPEPAPVQTQPIVERVFTKGLGKNFVSINARISLGREQAIKWEFTYIEDADLAEGEQALGAKLSTETIIENIGEIGLCADSLYKLKNRDWSNTVIVMDEIELNLNHVATSSTCRDKRSEILQVLQDKIKESLDNGGLLIGADADITDVTVDYLKAIVPNHTPFIVTHDYKDDPWEITFHSGKRDEVLKEIEEHLADPNCEPIAVAIDNQKEAQALDELLKRKYKYLNNKIGGLIRIDSRITQQEFGKEFVKRPNESILKYKPKILIYTPSLGVGCSIDVEYFVRVYGLFFANLEPSQARQMLARIRQSIPRTVWAIARGRKVEDEAHSYLPEEIKKRMFGKNETATTVFEIALAKAVQEVKASGIENPEDKDVNPVLLETLRKMIGPDGSWNNPHIDLWCNQTARRNFALSQFAVQLRQELIEEGHDIIDIDCEESTTTSEQVKECKEEIRRRDSELTARAADISFKEAQELKRKAARTTEQEYQITKAFLKNDLPELKLTPDFIYKAVHQDNGRWLSQTKLFWLLNNPEALVNKDDKHWKAKLAQFSVGVTCLWDLKLDGPKVEAIIKSGLFDWIKLDDLGAEYYSSSEGGQEFLNKCLSNKKMLRDVFGMTVKPESHAVVVADRLLSKLGLGLIYSNRTNDTKYYKLDQDLINDSDRQAVFEALDLKWKNEQARIAEIKAQKATQPVTDANNLLYKNEAQSPEGFVSLPGQKLTPATERPNNKPDSSPDYSVTNHTTNEEFNTTGINQSGESEGADHSYSGGESSENTNTKEDTNTTENVESNESTGADEVFIWKGKQFRIIANIQLANSFLQEQYDGLVKWAQNFPSGILTADCEPVYAGISGMWRVWVGSVGALKSVPCEWLEFIGFP